MTIINRDRQIYEKTFHVAMRECDMFRRLRPSAVLTMFQDCSEDLTENWGVGLDYLMKQGLIWVVARVKCQVRSLPHHGDQVTFRGWAGQSQLGIYPYEYHIENQKGQELITGNSLWTIADLQSHSMMSPNIPRFNLPSPDAPDSFLPKMPYISTPESFETTQRRVLFSETDINGHLTNTKYLDWACDLIPSDFHKDHPMSGFRIDYRAECRPDEEIPLDWSLNDMRLWCRSNERFTLALTFKTE